MSIRRYFNFPAALALLGAAFWTTQPSAQTSAVAPANTAAPAAAANAGPPAYRSAFEGYQPYTDEKIVNWKEANDAAGRIGGWREYAKEASQPQAPERAAADPGSAVPATPGQEKP